MMNNPNNNNTTKIISLNCVNCSSPIEFDIDNIISTCPNCGSRLLIDVDSLGQILLAKEQNKGNEIEAQKQIELQKINAQSEANVIKKYILFNIIAFSFLITLFILTYIFHDGGTSIGNSIKKHQKDTAQIGINSEDIDGMNVDDLKEELEDSGFKNVHTLKSKEKGGFFNWPKKGDVLSVTVDGKEAFKAEDWFDVDDKIVITYYYK